MGLHEDMELFACFHGTFCLSLNEGKAESKMSYVTQLRKLHVIASPDVEGCQCQQVGSLGGLGG